jgi:hypothetical protein
MNFDEEVRVPCNLPGREGGLRDAATHNDCTVDGKTTGIGSQFIHTGRVGFRSSEELHHLQI